MAAKDDINIGRGSLRSSKTKNPDPVAEAVDKMKREITRINNMVYAVVDSARARLQRLEGAAASERSITELGWTHFQLQGLLTDWRHAEEEVTKTAFRDTPALQLLHPAEKSRINTEIAEFHEGMDEATVQKGQPQAMLEAIEEQMGRMGIPDIRDRHPDALPTEEQDSVYQIFLANTNGSEKLVDNPRDDVVENAEEAQDEENTEGRETEPGERAGSSPNLSEFSADFTHHPQPHQYADLGATLNAFNPPSSSTPTNDHSEGQAEQRKKASEAKDRLIQELEKKLQKEQERTRKVQEEEKLKFDRILAKQKEDQKNSEDEMRRFMMKMQQEADKNHEEAQRREAERKADNDQMRNSAIQLQNKLRDSDREREELGRQLKQMQKQQEEAAAANRESSSRRQRATSPPHHAFHDQREMSRISEEGETTDGLEVPRHLSLRTPVFRDTRTELDQVRRQVEQLLAERDAQRNSRPTATTRFETPRPTPVGVREPVYSRDRPQDQGRLIKDTVNSTPKFSGDICHYEAFKERFFHMVHDNALLETPAKCIILEQLLEKRARDCISAAANVEDRYKETLSLLQQTYGNKEDLDEQILERFQELPLDAHDFDAAMAQIARHSSLTSQLSAETKAQAKAALLKKLPRDVVAEVVKTDRTMILEGRKKLEIDEVLEVLRRHLTTQRIVDRKSGEVRTMYSTIYQAESQYPETIMHALSNNQQSDSTYNQGNKQNNYSPAQGNNRQQQGSNNNRVSRKTEMLRNAVRSTLPSWKHGSGPHLSMLQHIFPLASTHDGLSCAIHGQGHSNAGCPSKWQEIREIIERDGRCIGCGLVGHSGTDCTSTYLCFCCQGRHITSGCSRKEYFLEKDNWPMFAVKPRTSSFFRGPQGNQQ